MLPLPLEVDELVEVEIVHIGVFSWAIQPAHHQGRRPRLAEN